VKIGVVAMQRDEGRLLETWIRYYDRLLGGPNITIFDNGSSDELTRAAIASGKEKYGVSIVTTNGPGDYENKGKLISAFIKSRPDYDWIIPTDIDDFAGVLIDGERFTTAPDLFVDELRAADVAGKPLVRIKRSIKNIPHTTAGYFTPRKKVIVKPSAGIELDHGYHLYSFAAKTDALDASLFYESKICYLHFHNRPFAELQTFARFKLAGRVKDFSEGSLRNYRGRGEYLPRYLLWTEAEYLDHLPAAQVELASVLESLGLAVPHSQPR
jgi:hypothetical protein